MIRHETGSEPQPDEGGGGEGDEGSEGNGGDADEG
jgi:hypothetical protein